MAHKFAYEGDKITMDGEGLNFFERLSALNAFKAAGLVKKDPPIVVQTMVGNIECFKVINHPSRIFDSRAFSYEDEAKVAILIADIYPNIEDAEFCYYIKALCSLLRVKCGFFE